MTKEELFETHQNIVYYCYSKLYKDEFIEKSKDDLIQEGFLALWKACSFYNESLNIKMSTYAFAAIQNSMLRWIKINRSYYYNFVSFDEPIKDIENEELTIGETIPDYDILESTVMNIEEILKIYRKWLIRTHVNSNKTYINNRLYRANIILNELLTREKVTARFIDEEYNINRTVVSKIFKELREALKEDYPTKYKNGGNITWKQKSKI